MKARELMILSVEEFGEFLPDERDAEEGAWPLRHALRVARAGPRGSASRPRRLKIEDFYARRAERQKKTSFFSFKIEDFKFEPALPRLRRRVHFAKDEQRFARRAKRKKAKLFYALRDSGCADRRVWRCE